MKYIYFLLLVVGLWFMGEKIFENQDAVDTSVYEEMKVLIVVNSKKHKDHKIIDAYKSVLEEEGVSFSFVSNETLVALSPVEAATHVPAIIFPEFVNQHLIGSTDYWIGEYVKSGGKVALIYDVDTKEKEEKYKIAPSYLDRFIGVNLAIYEEGREESLSYGFIKFRDKKSASYFGIPTSKIDKDNTIVGYEYGELTYPVLNIQSMIEVEGQTVYAQDEHDRPLIVRRDFNEGSALYINVPLGYLKGRSDDLLIRSFLRTFLFKIAHVPHIVSTPNAKGTLVINWHIDSDIEHETLPWNFEHGYLRKDMNQTFHITAGPYRDYPGDGIGYDATGKGKALVKKMMEYGEIGSHGGWGHNWFADLIEKKQMKKPEIKKYIKMNNEALESITGYKMTEYSAPKGVFPPKVNVQILKELGMTCYYYTGDAGSSPNRTFFDGKMLSEDIIAFPVMSFGTTVSMYEFNEDNLSKEKIGRYYHEFADYMADNRVARLFYSHPYDIHDYDYKEELAALFDYVKKLEKEGRMQTRTLGNIRNFIVRLVGTDKTFQVDKHGIGITVNNSDSLDEFVVAVPKRFRNREVQVDQSYDEDEHYYYIPLAEGKKRDSMQLNFKETRRTK